LLLIIFNTNYFLDFEKSSGEFIIYNRTVLDSSLTPVTWLTAGDGPIFLFYRVSLIRLLGIQMLAGTEVSGNF
jgi:hypothetical protein